jgi:hypothetical protein
MSWLLLLPSFPAPWVSLKGNQGPPSLRVGVGGHTGSWKA